MNINSISEVIAQGLGGEPEDLLDAYDDGYGGIEGQFFDRGLVFDYAINNDGLTYQENRVDSDYIHAYFQGQLEAQGIRCDADNAYEFYMGYQGVERNDEERMNCQYGQCGGRCLKQGEKCQLNERVNNTMIRGRIRGAQAKGMVKGAVRGAQKTNNMLNRAEVLAGQKATLKERAQIVKEGAVQGAKHGGDKALVKQSLSETKKEVTKALKRRNEKKNGDKLWSR